MPKILINEIDKTKPGTPDGYSNYSVLLPGFVGTKNTDENADIVQPDANGIYEFTSDTAFKDTIGLVPPKVGAAGIVHYGNQMAYELLKLGYTVIFKPITNPDDFRDISNETFWELFKDKANYDFRFVSHGLLESGKLSDYEEYNEAAARLVDVQEASELLASILTGYNDIKDVEEGYDDSTEKATFCDNWYKYGREYAEAVYSEEEPANTHEDKKINDYYKQFEGFAVNDEFYGTFNVAQTGVTEELEELNELINSITNNNVTTAQINSANVCIANLAKYNAATDNVDTGLPGRGDCVALLELDEKTYISGNKKPELLICDAIDALSSAGITDANGKFCALTVPSVYYKMTIDPDNPTPFSNNTKFPGAFHYLACFMKSLNQGFAEWYAAAGYTRGVSNYAIEKTSVKLGEIAINALEPRNYTDVNSPMFACNVIANFRGSYYLWGNRTAHPIGKKGSLTNGDLVASSFLNIRHLCTTIKKQLYVACRMFTFDPNSDTLWFNFVNAIKPTLEAMKADQGIRDYKILKVTTDKKATLKAKIRIIPIEAVEDFDLEISLEDSFGETTAVVTE